MEREKNKILIIGLAIMTIAMSTSVFAGTPTFVYGTCSNAAYTTQSTCVAAGATWLPGLYTNSYYFALAANETGTCSIGSYTTQATCAGAAVCSDVNYLTKATCEAAGKTWSPTWTPSGTGLLKLHKSCGVTQNWNNGDCDYLYACYIVLPKSATGFSAAIAKSCEQVTDLATYTLPVSVVPPSGNEYSVTAFITMVHYMYNGLSTTFSPGWSVYVNGISVSQVPPYTWYVNDTTTPLMLASDVISPCPEGQMLGITAPGAAFQCYNALPVCTNSMSSNMCTNPFDIYCLDTIGTLQSPASNSVVLANCNDNVNWNVCTDRDKDGICDYKISSTCTDIQKCVGGVLSSGSNNICDDSDTYLCGTQCVDMGPVSGGDGVCDSVEGVCSNPIYTDKPRCEGAGGTWTWNSVACPLIYNPVCYTLTSSITCSATQDCSNTTNNLPTTYSCIGANPVAGTTGTCKQLTTYPNKCFADAMGKTGYQEGTACLPTTQLVQCYYTSDCPAITCTGAGVITPVCKNYACSYSGTCGKCVVSSDCPPTRQICAGIAYQCISGVCQLSGQCITQPQQPTSIWTYILDLWTKFWTALKNLIGW